MSIHAEMARYRRDGQTAFQLYMVDWRGYLLCHAGGGVFHAIAPSELSWVVVFHMRSHSALLIHCLTTKEKNLIRGNRNLHPKSDLHNST